MIKAIIIEDDPMVLAINKKYMQKNPRIQIVKTFSDGSSAYEYLVNHSVDLILLDVYMPNLTGIDLLRMIREQNLFTEVIMVTAANDITSINTALSLGIVDYLVKPFEYSRFKTAIEKFLNRYDLIHSQSINKLTQQEIDKLLATNKAKKTTGNGNTLEKGFQQKTLDIINKCIQDCKGIPMSSETIAEKTGFSRVTVKRYLDYMEKQNLVKSDIDYETKGRPCLLYFSL